MMQREEDTSRARTVIWGALAAVLAYVFARNLPDILRYIKISRM